MLFFVQAISNARLRATLRRESERCLQFATDRFHRDIRDLGVVLRDINGPHGGIDKLCRVTARLRRGGSLEVEEKRTSFSAAISAAAKRLRRVLSRRIGGKKNRSVRRLVRAPYRRHWEAL